MYAALRWIEARGGTQVIILGRREVLPLYRKVGFESLGCTFQSGRVVYELLSADVASLRWHARESWRSVERVTQGVRWLLDVPMHAPVECFHGGAFFDAVGSDFRTLGRRREVINADVLDAWFDPAPGVISALTEHLPWLLRTSPPTQCEGFVLAVSAARGVPERCVLPGAGSSDLIYLALPRWLSASSRVLLLDPTYGEYAHVLERVIGCRVDRFALRSDERYDVSPRKLQSRLAAGYDLAVLVNPNSPTGRHIPGVELERVLAAAPRRTRFWIDETYVDYVSPGESLERLAAASSNVVVCKSMSKVYALSGARAAYLCGPPPLLDALRPFLPPWAISLPGQLAAVRALDDPAYYAERYRRTAVLRDRLMGDLLNLGGIDVVAGVANFLLCHLDESWPPAAALLERCRAAGLYLRDVSSMGTSLPPGAVRVAVKDAATNARMVEILAAARDADSGRQQTPAGASFSASLQ